MERFLLMFCAKYATEYQRTLMQIQNLNHSQMPINTSYVRNKDNFSISNNESYTTDSKSLKEEKTKEYYQKSTAAKIDTQNVGESTTQEVKQSSEIEPNAPKMEDLEGHKNRITYGLKVLELMSDEEYKAFLWASEGMSEMEKMLMAQSLYRFTEFYQGRDSKNMEQNGLDNQKIQAQRAFGVEQKNIDDFINRYKNAYDKVLESQYAFKISGAVPNDFM